MQAQTTKKQLPKGDRELSTYRWELYLVNGVTMDGYSKFVGHAEKQDKEALLEDCIQRLGNCGYFSKCYQMIFYKREFMHKSKDTKLLELYSAHYIAFGELNFRLPTLLYLDRVYERITSGNTVDFKGLIGERAAFRANEREDFQFTKERFPTIEHVVTHCAEYLLREKQYPRSRVEGWYHKVKHYYSNQNLPQASPTVRPASVDVAPVVPEQAPHKAAERVIGAVNALHSRHQSKR